MAGIVSKTVVLGAAALVTSAAAWSATLASPSVIAMNLQPADVPGAKLVSQRVIKAAGFVAAFDRNFSWKPGTSQLLTLESETLVASSTAVAAKNIATVQKGFSGPVRRKAFVTAVAKAAKVTVKAVAVGTFRKVAGYDQGFELPISIKLKGGRAYENLTYLRLDRVVVFLFEVAIRPIGAPVTLGYASAIAAHVGTELAPHLVAPPVVSGTPQQGQTLTVTPGTWLPAGAAVTYQWQRCDAAGANCAAVPGATTSTYAVTAADVGAILKANVTATNRFGSLASSAAEGTVAS